MPVTDPVLWSIIRDWSLPGSSVRRLLRETAVSLTFAQGLAEDYFLLLGNADGVEAEYRRWLYLCAVQGRRLQGSDWMARAERWHRQDAASWQALVDGPLAGVEMSDPVPRDPANDDAYAETLALYAQAFPDGPLFGKVWPASWHDRIARWHLWPFSLTAIGFGGLLIAVAPEGAPRGLGTLLLVAGGLGSGVAGWVSPWTGDYGSGG